MLRNICVIRSFIANNACTEVQFCRQIRRNFKIDDKSRENDITRITNPFFLLSQAEARAEFAERSVQKLQKEVDRLEGAYSSGIYIFVSRDYDQFFVLETFTFSNGPLYFFISTNNVENYFIFLILQLYYFLALEITFFVRIRERELRIGYTLIIEGSKVRQYKLQS